MDKYMFWLDNIVNLGCRAKCSLLNVFETPEGVYKAGENNVKEILGEKKFNILKQAKENRDFERKWEDAIQKGIRMLTIMDEHFPERLKNIPDPPFALYYLGNIPREELPSVAVVGARECSEYGKYIAGELGKCLGENGIQVISGMARGIDGISQYAALEAGGVSYGIMGCGVDICYPAGNRKVYEKLIEEGGVLSTYPPGTAPQSRLFPPRNRIVSGLSDVLVVIEARQKSGTSITVEMALEQGRDVYAVPGRVTDRLSDGCNKMIREGAHVFLSPQDFMEELKQLVPMKMECISNRDRENVQRMHQEEHKNRKEKRLLSVLDFYPRYVDDIADRLKTEFDWEVSAADLNVLLMQLFLEDKVCQETPGWFSVSMKKA